MPRDRSPLPALLLTLGLLLPAALRAEDPYKEAMEGDQRGIAAGLMGMLEDREAMTRFDGLVESQIQHEEGRIFVKDGRRYIRVTTADRFQDIAREAYGDPHQWFLVYYHNRHFLASKKKGDDLVLYLPPPPSERLREAGGQKMLMVIPGDSFPAIASQVYGHPGFWQVPYEANRIKLPDPSDPSFLFEDPPKVLSKYFVLPQLPEGAQPATSDVAAIPRTRIQPRGWQGVDGHQAVGDGATPTPSAGEAQAAPIPQSFRELRLSNASQVGRREAEIVLQAAGFYADRIYKKHAPPATSRYEAALAALTWGKTYKKPRNRVALDAKSQQWVLEEYQLLSKALRRYQGWSHISKDHRPQEYQSWVQSASGELTNVSASQRVALMQSLMTTESGKTHWQGYRPVISHAGAVGFGQLMPATAKELGVNPYDPADNIRGIAILLNRNIAKANKKGLSGRAALRQALAEYNGGGKPPASSYKYADGILARLS